MENKKENFYLFLDIDGVLWDWKWRLSEIKQGRIRKGSFITEFNPESIDALNNLINYINGDYDCNLVISSSWRNFMTKTLSTLKKNKLILPKIVDRTELSIRNNYRGEEIINYLQDKDDNDNYVIIDDDMHDFKKFFNPSRIIKTNIYDESLRHHHILDYIKSRENNMDKDIK